VLVLFLNIYLWSISFTNSTFTKQLLITSPFIIQISEKPRMTQQYLQQQQTNRALENSFNLHN
jgi:hypothetical protein